MPKHRNSKWSALTGVGLCLVAAFTTFAADPPATTQSEPMSVAQIVERHLQALDRIESLTMTWTGDIVGRGSFQ